MKSLPGLRAKPSLTWLKLDEHVLTDASKDTLLSLTGLQHLNLTGNNLSPEVVQQLKAGLPHTYIIYTPRFTTWDAWPLDETAPTDDDSSDDSEGSAE